MYLEYSAKLRLLQHTSRSDSMLSSLLLLQYLLKWFRHSNHKDQVLHGGAFVFARSCRSNAKLFMHFSDSAWFESNYPHNNFPTAIKAGMFYIVSQIQHKKRIISQNVCPSDFKHLDPGFKSSLWMTTKMVTTPGLTHWKAKVLPYSFLAVRKRASLAGGLLSSRNWWEVCMNFSCCDRGT